MACRFTELVLDCRDPQALAPFWAEVLGYRVTESDDELVELAGPPGSGPTLVLAKVPEGKTVKNRMHVDVNATDRDQAAEVERILALGATYADVGQAPDASWVVLADPEGNELCVLRSRVPDSPDEGDDDGWSGGVRPGRLEHPQPRGGRGETGRERHLPSAGREGS